jgi:antitoxin component YwqK of YwqJK toxin-antitoxin module
MKIAFYLPLFLFISLLTIGQPNKTLVYLDAKGQISKQYNAIKYAIVFFEDDRWKKEIYDVVDDKLLEAAYYKDSACTYLDGPYRAYNKLQNIHINGQYADNKKSGIWKSWSDKTVVDSAFYKDGFKHGLALKWNHDGVITDSLQFEENGKGVARGFWENGIIRETGIFLAGQKNGLWTYYFK